MTDKPIKRSPLTGKMVIIKSKDPQLDGQKYWIEEWYVNMGGTTVLDDLGSPAAIIYRARKNQCDLPSDHNYFYGKIGSYGHIIHETEIGEVTDDPIKYSSYNWINYSNFTKKNLRSWGLIPPN